MTDRELLELAAKAAGVEVAQFELADGCFEDTFRTADGYWNPLTDDGDALRLAMKLAIHMRPYNNAVFAEHSAVFNIYEDYNNNPEAAARRAIVRAAAEIGKGMK
jgi:hypothetical protein